jgi:hypothetical protein
VGNICHLVDFAHSFLCAVSAPDCDFPLLVIFFAQLRTSHAFRNLVLPSQDVLNNPRIHIRHIVPVDPPPSLPFTIRAGLKERI